MSYLDTLKKDLILDEGKRNKMYLDSKGIPSIGIGHNLRDRPISDRAVQVIFEDDMEQAEEDAKHLFPTFDTLSEVRKAVLVNMSFNLGLTRLAAFKKVRTAVSVEDFETAAREMLDSAWANQVGDRAKRLAAKMKEG